MNTNWICNIKKLLILLGLICAYVKNNLLETYTKIFTGEMIMLGIFFKIHQPRKKKWDVDEIRVI